MKFKMKVSGFDPKFFFGEKAVAVASDDYYRKPHAWNPKAGAFVLLYGEDGAREWHTVAPEQLVEVRGVVWFDKNEYMSNGRNGVPELAKIIGVRWITSAGNLCEIRLAGDWETEGFDMVLVAEGRRHGIPWLFDTAELDEMWDEARVIEYETHAPSQRPWVAGVEAEIPVKEDEE